jgi:hypothetical protein
LPKKEGGGKRILFFFLLETFASLVKGRGEGVLKGIIYLAKRGSSSSFGGI